MAKKEDSVTETELDEHGLVIHRYESTILVVVPAGGYAETTLRYARSALFNVHVGTFAVSSNDEDLIVGELQDEFQADGNISEASMGDYAGLLVAGGPGAVEMAENADARRLASEAQAQGKLIGAWGEGTGLLAAAGVVSKKKVTGHPAMKKALEAAGARYTGTQVQKDGKLVTAYDDAAGFRFGKALVQIVAI
jgi:protease I